MKKMDKFNTKDLRLIQIRKYNGIEDGMHSWTFCAYDFARVDKDGKLISVLASENVEYDNFVEYVFDEDKKRKFINHGKVNVGEVKVVVVNDLDAAIFGEQSTVTLDYLKWWAMNNPYSYHFKYCPSDKMDDVVEEEFKKVKTINKKK